MSHILHANYGGQNRLKFAQSNNHIYLSWKNQDNDQFYTTISPEKLQHFAAIAGLDTYADLKLLQSYITEAEFILEIGGGYGRVLEYILINHSSSNLFTIERNLKLYSLLKNKFKKKIKIFNEDLINFQIDRQFDLILWLWEGISEFSDSEQFLALKQLATLLKPNGFLIVDTLFPKLKSLNANRMSGKYSEIKIEDSVIKIHRPSLQDMSNLGKKLGFHVEYLKYQTTTLRPRILYILKKSAFNNFYEIP